jgi:arsenite oxidase small subunit
MTDDLVKTERPNSSSSLPEEKSDHRGDESRRNFLKVAVTLSALFVIGGIAALTKSITQRVGSAGSTSTATAFPRVKIANVSALSVNQPVIFNYPLDNEPNILVKIGQKAEGGVGPDNDIVAFSQICQHLGCLYAYESPGSSPDCNTSYKAPGPEGYCCCHGSIYDFANGGKVVGGPSPRPIPQVILEVDSTGDIYAIGMTPPAIFGHNTGSSDVSSDLQGGNLV